MPNTRTIAVVTGTRAEFGLLSPVMRAIDAHPALRLFTVVAGTHLLPRGDARPTWHDVRESGFRIDARVRMQRESRTGRDADVQAFARGVAGVGKVLAAARPDVVMVLGDRIEAFAAASAGSIGGIHVAHIHGGDRAEGVADEAMRHAISKLAHLHFPATALSRKRLVRMGEDERFVWNVGSPAMDGLREVEAASDAPFLIVLQHPIGESEAREKRWMRATLQAVEDVIKRAPRGERGRGVLHLRPNHDPGRAGIVAAQDETGVACVAHLPRQRWLAMLKGAGAIVGNSSAGLIEAAGLRVPCVNIGPRQVGREHAGNVVDCEYGRENVLRAIEAALRIDRRRLRHPYGKGGTGEQVAALLAGVDLERVPVRKCCSY